MSSQVLNTNQIDPVSFCSSPGVCQRSSHPVIASILLIPLVVNYLVCFLSFLRCLLSRHFSAEEYFLDWATTKRWLSSSLSSVSTQSLVRNKEEVWWIFLEIFLTEAAKVIYLLLRDPQSGEKRSEMFYQNISLHEGFLESVPTILIMTVIWRAALGQVMSVPKN